MTNPSHSNVGRVYLVGAGPGAPELITLRGVECLRKADVILYDYLVNPLLLRHARPDAVKTSLGKHRHERIWTQAEINAQLIKFGHEGKTVVRLKSGDPSVFGRGAEEGDALAQAGIPFEVVPGITAGLAASSYGGIPITHREFSSAVALVTGHEDADKTSSSLDFAALASFPGTLVFYMGVTTVDRWSAALLNAGKPASTPVGIIRRCSFPDQQVMTCTLGTVAKEYPKERLRPPVIFLVGEACTWQPTLGWFSRRPLFGQKIVVTRPEHQASSLADPLAEAGADVLFAPTITIGPADDTGPLNNAIDHLKQYNWIVFASANGVHYFLKRLLERGFDLRQLGQSQLAAIGSGTAQALQEYHLNADLIPEEFRAESLAAASFLRFKQHHIRAYCWCVPVAVVKSWPNNSRRPAPALPRSSRIPASISPRQILPLQKSWPLARSTGSPLPALPLGNLSSSCTEQPSSKPNLPPSALSPATPCVSLDILQRLKRPSTPWTAS